VDRLDHTAWSHDEDAGRTDADAARDDMPDGGRFARLWPLAWVVWLVVLGAPIAALVHAHPALPRLVALLAGLALFVAVYLWVAWRNNLSRPPSAVSVRGPSWLPLAVLTILGLSLTLAGGPRWLGLFIFASASVGARLAPRLALRAVAALMLLTAAMGWLTRDAWADLAQATFLVGVVGCLVIALSWAVTTTRALHAARAENARLAVEAERLRIARDLHDLLGHDLAHIALKSDLAEALVPTAPDEATAAMREVGDAARAALQELRATVAGYRQPTLASELRAARALLAAAGISYRFEGPSLAVPPATEAVLAWAVREGVTNVIKHSRARHCTIRVIDQAGTVGIEVVDDGRGARREGAALSSAAAVSAAVGRTGGGHGLAGLHERVAALGGQCGAGPGPEGGFRLFVLVPAAPAAGRGAESRPGEGCRSAHPRPAGMTMTAHRGSSETTPRAALTGRAGGEAVPIRTPDQRVRVFVSSTLVELAAERDAARGAITRLHLTPVLFELGARPHPPQTLYRAYLAQSDVFIGLYWQRYGWVAPDMDISGLEDEYRLAADKPKLIYVKTPAPEREPQLAALLRSIRDDNLASYKSFTTAGQVRRLIEEDLAVLLSERFVGSGALAPPPQPGDNLPAGGAAPPPHTGRIRVLLAEDQGTVRDALAALLALQPDIAIVGAVARGDEVLSTAVATRPDVALLDIEMPGLDGLEAAAQLHERLPACKVLILTTFGRPGYLRRAMQSGAVGFLVKEAPAAQLAVAIRRAVAGERIVDPALAAAALSEGDGPRTEREAAVLAATTRGATIGDIAATLTLREAAVRRCLSEATRKLGARTPIEAALIAEQHGWL
jgi:signal transduction histidine kinase/DNA-binding NarL/FixJ family response regulator